VNTGLVKLPRTFAQLEREALAFRKRKAGNLAIAVPQGTPNDAAYYTYPLFSGLGGYTRRDLASAIAYKLTEAK